MKPSRGRRDWFGSSWVGLELQQQQDGARVPMGVWGDRPWGQGRALQLPWMWNWNLATARTANGAPAGEWARGSSPCAGPRAGLGCATGNGSLGNNGACPGGCSGANGSFGAGLGDRPGREQRAPGHARAQPRVLLSPSGWRLWALRGEQLSFHHHAGWSRYWWE